VYLQKNVELSLHEEKMSLTRNQYQVVTDAFTSLVRIRRLLYGSNALKTRSLLHLLINYNYRHYIL
jgi:hypothetical protein